MPADETLLVQKVHALAQAMGWECNSLHDEIVTAIQALKNELLGGAGEAVDTLKELADLIGTNQDAIAALEALAAGHVKFSGAQTLTNEQKAQARNNIGAASEADLSTLSTELGNAVLYTSQTLSTAQQAQARTNIGALAADALGDLSNIDFVNTFESALETGQPAQDSNG